MSLELLEQNEDMVVEMAKMFLDNMSIQLGRKYTKRDYEVNAGLTDIQHVKLKEKYDFSYHEFLEFYASFKKMQPTSHLIKLMEAFSASGGNVDIEPLYDKQSQRLEVSVKFAIGDKELEKIEGLTAIEDLFLKMNAMIQLESVISDAKPDEDLGF